MNYDETIRTRLQQEAQIFDLNIHDAVLTHSNPDEACDAIVNLVKANLFSSENCQVVLSHRVPFIVISVLIALRKKELLTPENRNAMLSFLNPSFAIDHGIKSRQGKWYQPGMMNDRPLSHSLFLCLCRLDHLRAKRLLSPSERNELLKELDFERGIEALQKLSHYNQLTSDNREIVLHYDEPDDAAEVFIKMKEENVFSLDNYTAVMRHFFPRFSLNAIVILAKNKLLTSDALTCIWKKFNSVVAAKIYVYMHHHEIFTLDNYNSIIEKCIFQSQINKSCDALIKLKEATLFQPEMCALVLEEKRDPVFAANLVIEMNKHGIFSAENYEKVIQHYNLYHAVFGMVYLKKAGLFSAEYIDLMLQQPNPYLASRILIYMHKNRFFSFDNYKTVVNHPEMSNSINVLCILHYSNLLTADNRKKIENHKNVEYLKGILKVLYYANILSEKNFELSVTYAYQFYQVDAIKELLGKFRPGLFKQKIFDEMLRIFESNHYDIQKATDPIVSYLRRVLRDVNIFNRLENTHTASIHASASSSALKLFQRYPIQIAEDQLNVQLNNIREYVTQLAQANTQNKKLQIAKKFINWFIQNEKEARTFTDPVSKVSLEQLLALAWVAINDVKQENYEEALKCLIEGFSEMYCGVKRDGSDLWICRSGMFNKLIEKLVSFHEDVTLVYMTKESATLKLKCLVREEAEGYLLALASEVRDELVYEHLIEVKTVFSQDGLEEGMYELIKAKVSDRYWSEFFSLYKGKNDPEFINAIEAGCYVDLREKMPTEKQLKAKTPYFQSQQNKQCLETEVGLFSLQNNRKRIRSDEAQNKVDENKKRLPDPCVSEQPLKKRVKK